MSPDRTLELLTRYRETIRCTWMNSGDVNSWPVKLNAAFHLFGGEFGDEVLADIRDLETEGRSHAEIARPFGTPSRLYRQIDSVIYSLRRNRRPIDEQRRWVAKLIDMVATLKHGSVFNEDGSNIVLGPGAIAAGRFPELPIENRSAACSAARFCALMSAYTDSLFFRAHDASNEIHGPYVSNDGRTQVLVKQYFNLRPIHLWPEMPLLSRDEITVYLRYNRDVRFQVDALNHLSHEGASPVDALESCGIEIDGVSQPIAVLDRHIVEMRETISAVSRWIESIGWNDRVVKYGEIFWFRKRPLSDQRGRDWRLPSAVRDAILAGAPDARRTSSLASEATERLASLTI
jgi:hypothetical protein